MTNPGNLFSTFGYAQATAAEILAGIAAAQALQPNEPLPSDSIAPRIVDSINDPDPANRDYASNFSVPPPATQPPPPDYYSIFELKGSVMIGANEYLVQQVLGSFGARETNPDQAQGDKNYIQVGVGANEVNAPVAGTPVGIQFLDEPPTEGIAQPFYTAP